MIRKLAACLAALALTACATDMTQVVKPGMTPDEVGARAGKPGVQNDAYWDYSRQPWGYYRVTYGPDKRVREVRNLHTEDNFRKLQPGMTQQQVVDTVGVSSWNEGYAASSSWKYRYRDAGIAKNLHVIFNQDRRLAWYYWEWDPDVYSKGGPTGDRM